jgi:phosphatidate cytidylyltransferase
MVADPNLLNPLTNPIFMEVLKRFVYLFIAGFFLVLILKKFNLREMWMGELGKRYLSWLAIGIIFMSFVFIGGIPSLLFIYAVMILACWEVYKMAKLPVAYLYGFVLLATASVLVTSFFESKFYILPILYFAILTFITVRRNDTKGFSYLTTSMYASIWIIFFLCHFILLGHLNNNLDNTKSLLFMIGFAVPLADIGAYVFGKMFSKVDLLNKYKIADKISPKKIWAGVIGDIIGAGIGIAIMYFAVGAYFSIIQLVILACLIGIFSVIGDMNESLVKRYFKVKDSSNLIPGHGGILDRIDSVLRVIIIVYYFSLAVL